MTLSRLTDRAVMSSSPVTQQTESKEVIPWWALLPVAADLAETICRVCYVFMDLHSSTHHL